MGADTKRGRLSRGLAPFSTRSFPPSELGRQIGELFLQSLNIGAGGKPNIVRNLFPQIRHLLVEFVFSPFSRIEKGLDPLRLFALARLSLLRELVEDFFGVFGQTESD